MAERAGWGNADGPKSSEERKLSGVVMLMLCVTQSTCCVTHSDEMQMKHEFEMQMKHEYEMQMKHENDLRFEACSISINQRIYLHFLSSRLIRGVDRQ